MERFADPMKTLAAGAVLGAALYLLVDLLFHLIPPQGGSTFGFFNFNPVLIAAVAMTVGAVKGTVVGALAFTRIPWLVRIASVFLFNYNSVRFAAQSFGNADRFRLLAAVCAIVVFAGSIACAELVLRTRRPSLQT